jgi:putative inorganic carbon (HCO3(-)) transporter
MDEELDQKSYHPGRLRRALRFIPILEWSCLLAANGLLVASDNYNRLTVIALALLVVFLGLRSLRGAIWPQLTGLEIPILMLLASAALGVWLSFNTSAAMLQFARMLGALGLFLAIADSGIHAQRWLAIGFLCAATGLALFWPLQHDFAAEQGKLSFIRSLGSWIQSVAPTLPVIPKEIHPNVAGGVLALAVPFGIALAVDFSRLKRTAWMVLTALATLIVMLGLVLTSSRGAWTGLACAIGLAILIWLQRRWFDTPSRKTFFWGIYFLLVIVCAIALVFSGKLGVLLGSLPDPTGTLMGRLQIWNESLMLARDFLFTGSGLMTFKMTHPIYVELIHVPNIYYSHNTFLEVWISQGLLGVLGIVWGCMVLASWFWRAIDLKNIAALGCAGLFGLVMLSIHASVDVNYYVGRTLPLVGLTTGYAWLSVHDAPPPKLVLDTSRKYALALLSGIVVLTLLVFYRQITAAWYANLGALSQTRTELSVYDPAHFDDPTLDLVRQRIDLDRAIALFDKALDQNPKNITALQRLSMIELSRREYAGALLNIQVAWDAGHRDSVTRELYGDALVANGEPERAAEVVRGLARAESRILGQAWYRYWLNQDYRRAADAWQTALILNPNNPDIDSWLSEARKNLAP